MLQLAPQLIPDTRYSKSQLEDILGSLSLLLADILKSDLVLSVDQTYHPFGTCLHVYSEALRVTRFVNICKSLLPDAVKGRCSCT